MRRFEAHPRCCTCIQLEAITQGYRNVCIRYFTSSYTSLITGGQASEGLY